MSVCLYISVNNTTAHIRRFDTNLGGRRGSYVPPGDSLTSEADSSTITLEHRGLSTTFLVDLILKALDSLSKNLMHILYPLSISLYLLSIYLYTFRLGSQSDQLRTNINFLIIQVF